MDVPELGQSAARARQEVVPDEDDETQLPPAPEVTRAETAFLVYRLPDGQVILNADLNAPVSVRRPPLSHDVIGMANCVIEDIRLMGHAPATAKAVVDAVQAKQQEQLKQMQDAQILAQLGRNGG